MIAKIPIKEACKLEMLHLKFGLVIKAILHVCVAFLYVLCIAHVTDISFHSNFDKIR